MHVFPVKVEHFPVKIRNSPTTRSFKIKINYAASLEVLLRIIALIAFLALIYLLFVDKSGTFSPENIVDPVYFAGSSF